MYLGSGTFVFFLDAGSEVYVLVESQADCGLDANEKCWITGEVVLGLCTLLGAHENRTEVESLFRRFLYSRQPPSRASAADAAGI